MKDELKPCPFCGCTAREVRGVFRGDGSVLEWDGETHIQCTSCGASVCIGVGGNTDEDIWNSRVHSEEKDVPILIHKGNMDAEPQGVYIFCHVANCSNGASFPSSEPCPRCGVKEAQPVALTSAAGDVAREAVTAIAKRKGFEISSLPDAEQAIADFAPFFEAFAAARLAAAEKVIVEMVDAFDYDIIENTCITHKRVAAAIQSARAYMKGK